MYYNVSDMTLYSIRSGILSKWSVLRTGVMFWGFSNSTGESILNSLDAVYLAVYYSYCEWRYTNNHIA